MVNQVLFCMLLALFLPHKAAGEIYVIANKAAMLKDISMEQLKHLFLDQSSLVVEGVRYSPLDAPASSATRKLFYERVANRTPVQMKSYWARMVFTGKALPPLAAESDAAVETIVSRDADKLGYIPHRPTHPNVQVVKVID